MGLLSPRYSIVRGGRPHTATPASHDELVALRTELELLRRFAAGASDRVMQALRQRLDLPDPPARGPNAEDLRDIITTIEDGLSSKTTSAINAIDRKHPDLAAELNMDNIAREGDQFSEDVLAAIKTSGAADAREIAREYKAARRKTSRGKTRAKAEPARKEDEEEVITDWAADLDDPGQNAAREHVAPSGAEDEDMEALIARALADTDAIEASTPGDGGAADEPALPPAGEDEANLTDEILAQAADTAHAAEGGPLDETGELLRELDVNEVLAAGSLPSEEPFPVADAAPENSLDAQAEDISSDLAAALADAGEQVAEANEALTSVGDSMMELSVEIAEATSLGPAAAAGLHRDCEDTGRPDSAGLQADAPAAPSRGTSPEKPRALAELKSEIATLEATFSTAFGQLTGILERVEDTWNTARAGAAEAHRFRELIARMDEAQSALADARAETDQAEAAFQASRRKLDAARAAWEQAHREAVTAAANLT